MTKFKYTLFLFLCFVGHSCFAQKYEVVDDNGQRVILKQPAQRIVSLAPDLTEIVFAAGAGNKLVGVVSGCDYPAAAKKIPVVANFNSVDFEKILSLHPDLIVVWSEGKLAQSLKKLGIPIYISHQQRISHVALTLHHIGCLAGTSQIADQAALDFLAQYRALQAKYSQREKISVFYQLWLQPLITVSNDSWIDDAITLCAGKNVFANLIGAAPEMNLEAVVARNPEVILGSDTRNDWKKYWQQWPNMTAVKTGNIFAVHADLIERASPRLLEGVNEICEALQTARDRSISNKTKISSSG